MRIPSCRHHASLVELLGSHVTFWPVCGENGSGEAGLLSKSFAAGSAVANGGLSARRTEAISGAPWRLLGVLRIGGCDLGVAVPSSEKDQ